jgi:hypothetical protein
MICFRVIDVVQVKWALNWTCVNPNKIYLTYFVADHTTLKFSELHFLLSEMAFMTSSLCIFYVRFTKQLRNERFELQKLINVAWEEKNS